MKALKTFCFVGCALLVSSQVWAGRSYVPQIQYASTATTASDAMMKQCIERGGAVKGWSFKDGEPGVLIGELRYKTHYVKIHVPYNKSGYALKVQPGTSVMDAEGKVHPNCNRWLKYLKAEIDKAIVYSR